MTFDQLTMKLTGAQRHVRCIRVFQPSLIMLEQEVNHEEDVLVIGHGDYREVTPRWVRATDDSIYVVSDSALGRPLQARLVKETGHLGYRRARTLFGSKCVVLVRQYKGVKPVDADSRWTPQVWWEDVLATSDMPGPIHDSKHR